MDTSAFLIGDALLLSELGLETHLALLEITGLTRALLELRVLEW